VQRSEVTAQAADPEPRNSRRALPDHLPREIEMHMPEHDACPECGGQLRRLGEDVSEMLERIPATYKVIRHVRPKFSCGRCQCIVQAPAPSRPLSADRLNFGHHATRCGCFNYHVRRIGPIGDGEGSGEKVPAMFFDLDIRPDGLESC
jgi:hypothetical protein